jgi:hypothetical protein
LRCIRATKVRTTAEGLHFEDRIQFDEISAKPLHVIWGELHWAATTLEICLSYFNIILALANCLGLWLLVTRNGFVLLLQALSWPALYVRTDSDCHRFLPHAYLYLYSLPTFPWTWHETTNGMAIVGGGQPSRQYFF